MAGHNSDHEAPDQLREAGRQHPYTRDELREPRDERARMSGAGIPAGLLMALVVVGLTLLGIGVRYAVHGDVNAIHCLFSVFFSANLLAAAWEMCLFLRLDHIAARADYWREWRRETGRTPAAEFLSTRIPLRRVLSPTIWADVWATYSMVDPAYEKRTTFGFMADVGNAFATPIPTLILYAAYTLGFLPAVAAGVIGAMLFWQWVYVTTLYAISFFITGRHTRVTKGETWGYIVGLNSVWVFIPMFGLYVSVRLIVDGTYAVLGF